MLWPFLTQKCSLCYRKYSISSSGDSAWQRRQLGALPLLWTKVKKTLEKRSRRERGKNEQGMYLQAFMHNINSSLMVPSETRPYAPWPLPLFHWTKVIKAIYTCRKGSRWHGFSLPKVLTALKKNCGKEIMAGCKRSYWVREKENKEEWKRKKRLEEEIIQEKMSISCNWRRIRDISSLKTVFHTSIVLL